MENSPISVFHLINLILDFLNNHLEEILLADIVFVVLGIIIFLATRVEGLPPKFFRRLVNQALYLFLAGSQFVLLLLTGYLYWLNYQSKPLITFEDRVLYRTDWVRDNLEIFFISGHNLMAMNVNGTNTKSVFEASDPIREYHFSPDGKYVVIVTERDVYLLSRETAVQQWVDSIGELSASQDVESVLRAVSWSPNSQKFCYELARWSKYSSQSQFYVYDVLNQQKIVLKTATRQIPFLFWDKNSDALYFFNQQALDPSISTYPYWLKLYKIPLATRQAVLVAQRPSKKFDIDLSHFTSLGADIFYEGLTLSYDRAEDDSHWTSQEGPHLGIDDDDYLYYIRGRWWRKRLFKVPREPLKGDILRYQYKGGPLVVRHVRWLPGARYVLMEHDVLGILILEPATGRLGQLMYAPGHTFGWYKPLNQMESNRDTLLSQLKIQPIRRPNDEILRSLEKIQKGISRHD